MGILDVLHVPATLPPGDYVLGCASPSSAPRARIVTTRWLTSQGGGTARRRAVSCLSCRPAPIGFRATSHLAPWCAEVWTNCADVRLEH